MPAFHQDLMPLIGAGRQARLTMVEKSNIQHPLWASTRMAATMSDQTPLPPHASHPSLPHLAMLVFEAVLEVVCVSLPGYIVARQGMFTSEMQKFTANLNVTLFTPCLIFIKLASQLTAEKLSDLAIIPLIFIIQTLVSFSCSTLISKAFGFDKRQKNFVVAMGVFGNSNSLPISLVLSLSQTIQGLHWDKVPGDNDDEVAARGILYLLIFQQLGQLLRWSWGYNVLLAPAEKTEDVVSAESVIRSIEEGSSGETEPLINVFSDAGSGVDVPGALDENRVHSGGAGLDHQPGLIANTTDEHHTQTKGSPSSSSTDNLSKSTDTRYSPSPNYVQSTSTSKTQPGPEQDADSQPIDVQSPPFFAAIKGRLSRVINRSSAYAKSKSRKTGSAFFRKLPKAVQIGSINAAAGLRRFAIGLMDFMNPPLWAMLAAILVASIPSLQHFFFDEGTFFKNSVTSAIRQSGDVAVPLILVVLGGNLARNTISSEENSNLSPKEERKLLAAALLSRMLLPTAIIAPILAVMAKYLPISIMEDPIFVIVCFLLTGAPSALQLAQICQINNVFVSTMSKLLFQSYVVWILPSTLVLVMLALEVVEWASR